MNILKLFIFTLIILINSQWVFANEIKILHSDKNNNIKINKELNRTEIFKFLSDFYDKKTPETYKYIKLNFIDINKNDEIYTYLQKLVYLDLIKNSNTKILKNSSLNAYTFYALSSKILKLDNIKLNEVVLSKDRNSNLTYKQILLNKTTKSSDLINVKSYFVNNWIKLDNIFWENKKIKQEKLIFEDVYNTLIMSHYDSSNINKVNIIRSAIEWLTKWVWDKFSVYFPPVETKDFYASLNWEYEWIWSYVDMEIPWVLKILSPIPWSPSEKAWLKWWDLIIKVNQKEIKKENSLKEVVSWIKWKAGTTVTLTIKRWNKIFDVDVKRAKIVIKDVEYKLLNNKTYLIKIKSFWEKVSINFKKAILDMKKYTNVKKVIIDLRNNWWWYLWQVSDMLSYFVPKWEQTAIVKYKSWSKWYNSAWYSDIDFSKYEIILLENSWTASASEIMIWTIKDYFPNSIIIWENSYGKWSVQTIKSYIDWSSLKYTIAKWFTWKKEIWIDWVWIKPDIEVVFDIEKFKKNWYDNQLEKAKNIR